MAGRQHLTANGDDIPVTGWRVFQTDMSSTRRERHAGSSSEAHWDSIWLDLGGTLKWAEIHLDWQIDGAMPGMRLSNHKSWRTWVSDLPIDRALTVSGHPPWREKTYGPRGGQTHECWRLAHRARPGTPPCLGVSKMVSDLRAGRESSNWSLDFG